MSRVLFYNSDNVVTIEGLTDQVTGEFQNSATISGVLVTSAVEDEAELISSFSFTYESDSDGVYHGVIPADDIDDLQECTTYFLRITATAGAIDTQWLEKVQIQYRGF